MASFRLELTVLAASALLGIYETPALSQQIPTYSASAATKDAKSSSVTPRLADGHPNLNGFWAGGGRASGAVILHHQDHVEIRVGDNNPPERLNAARNDHAEVERVDPNPPPYKPELLAKVKELEKNRYQVDPAFVCKPAGVPRVGPPNAIVQAPGMPIIFLNETLSGNIYRLIPIDGRPHDPDADPSYYGDSVGHWDGDTLVVDTTELNDDTWLGEPGWFHSTALHVIEHISRDDEGIRYEATVEDSGVFTRPWVMNPRTLRPTKEVTIETAPCMDRDRPNIPAR